MAPPVASSAFATPVPVQGINGAGTERGTYVLPDGSERTIYFAAGADIWTAVREAPTDQFGTPVPVEAVADLDAAAQVRPERGRRRPRSFWERPAGLGAA